ncbi:hypothetical protein TRVA0_011S00166 [Trichomonascus vanleenenianus]|uniref:uncharacterized protein n=1 Tax=Trichomonascus vanleenenianus TaxID=2268995 RepID=UPI003EC9B9E5
MTEPINPIHPDFTDKYDKQFVAFYEAVMQNRPPLHALSVEEAREAVAASEAVLRPGPEIASTEDLTLDGEGGEKIPVRVYTPTGTAPEGGWPLLVYFHGGGMVVGGLFSEGSHCAHWAETGRCVVMSVHYRLAPEHPFPAAVEDAWDAYKWAVRNPKALNINPTKLAVGGTSAGGTLTANVCHLVNAHNETSDEKMPQPLAQVLVVPSLDTRRGAMDVSHPLVNAAVLPLPLMAWFMGHYKPDSSDPRASPIAYPDESFRNQPPAHFFVAELDLLKFDAQNYASKLIKNGQRVHYHEYNGCPHTFTTMSGIIDKGSEAVDEIAGLLHNAFYKKSAEKL